jgi:diaminopimelate epimerase
MAKTLDFSKYHGTGNDFIVLDNRKGQVDFLSQELRALLCHRRFGVGADGIIYLENNENGLYMRYFNADGNIGSLCGNGSRCFVQYCLELGIWNDEGFYAADGHHKARLMAEQRIAIGFSDAGLPEQHDADWYLNTGSPHVVRQVQDLEHIDVIGEGKTIRHARRYQPGGTNANFIEQKQGHLSIRTFERGVEDETLSCGTGAVASALVWASVHQSTGKNLQPLDTRGGKLEVGFTFNGNEFHDIWLIGPAVHIMDGTWFIPQ